MSQNHRQIQFVETLGQGAFGAVYLADVRERSGFVQRLAVKILSAPMSACSGIAARQRDEARLLAQLNHHAILKVFDLIELGGRPAVLMEYVDGVDADVLCRAGALPPRAALQLIATASDALSTAYTTISPRTRAPLAVIHRDIKPANLLLSRHGGVKVLDFGIARAAFAREGVTTETRYGTVRYMAPELLLFEAYGPSVDIFALGVSAIELLTGEPGSRPPLGEAQYAAHLSAALSDLPAIPHRQELVVLLEEMLAFEPERRPSAGAVHDRLTVLCDALTGERLDQYARRVVPGLIAARRDALADRPLPDEVSFILPAASPQPSTPLTLDYLVEPEELPQPQPRERGAVEGRARLLALSAMLVVVSGLGMVSALEPHGPGGEVARPAERIDALPALAPEPLPAPDPQPAAVQPEPLPVAPPPVAVPSVEPASAAPDQSMLISVLPAEREPEVEVPEPAPVPAEAEVTAAPAEPVADLGPAEPVAARRPITFGASVMGTRIYLDDQLIGKTPLNEHPVTLGTHRLRMVLGEITVATTISVSESSRPSYQLITDMGDPRIIGR